MSLSETQNHIPCCHKQFYFQLIIGGYYLEKPDRPQYFRGGLVACQIYKMKSKDIKLEHNDSYLCSDEEKKNFTLLWWRGVLLEHYIHETIISCLQSKYLTCNTIFPAPKHTVNV